MYLLLPNSRTARISLRWILGLGAICLPLNRCDSLAAEPAADNSYVQPGELVRLPSPHVSAPPSDLWANMTPAELIRLPPQEATGLGDVSLTQIPPPAPAPTSTAMNDNLRTFPRSPAPTKPGVAIAADNRPTAKPAEGVIRLKSSFFKGGFFQVARQVEDEPAMPARPTQSTLPSLFSDQSTDDSAPISFDERVRTAARAPISPGTVAERQPVQSSAGAQQTTDLGQVLSQGNRVQNVEVQRRSPVSMDPNIRGFRENQIYSQANGQYWVPARNDLDTMLSKIDPGTVQNVTIIPGPYGVIYGPGFAFIDIQQPVTPRYNQGPEHHYSVSTGTRTNGGQVTGRETVWGGDQNFGYRITTGQRKGSNYNAGNGQDIPSNFEVYDLNADFGYSVTEGQRLEFSYLRLNQGRTAYAGEVFDISTLYTDGYNLRYIDEDPTARWSRMVVQSWFNHTTFNGDTSTNKFNPDFAVDNRITTALDAQAGLPFGSTTLSGATSGMIRNTGGRLAWQFGETDATHFNTGTDFRYLSQNITESYDTNVTNTSVLPTPSFGTNMPTAFMTDAGFFGELTTQLAPFWTTTIGGRIDYVSTTARAGEVDPNSFLSLYHTSADPDSLSQNNQLYALFLNNQVELTRNWTMRGGFGYAERAPSMIERYADGLFLDVLQNGISRVIGDPTLRKERAWQVDVGLSAEYDRFRGRVNAYQAWINDYITFASAPVTVPDSTGFNLVQYFNTPLATLSGVLMAGDYDLAPQLTTFGSMRFTEGRDQTLNAPLPSIFPMDSIVGLRFHDPQQGQRWGLEGFARIVNTQNRLGALHFLDTATGTGSLTDPSTYQEERTPGFTVYNLRSYWNVNQRLSITAGIDNLTNKNYQTHLDQRFLGTTGGFAPTRVLSPGITPYFSMNWTY